jgi:4-hydroxy-tetrahydrodipicolinate synthase
MTAIPNGIFAALITPWATDGSVAYSSFEHLVDFVASRGVEGLCVGGGSSEYPVLDANERKQLFRRTVSACPKDRALLAAIGSSSFARAVQLGEHAANTGFQAVLLPMPHFYRYQQPDLELFSRQVARALPIPTLLYDLPAFTNKLDEETIADLLLEEANITGLKDSSGEAGRVSSLAALKSKRDLRLFVGNDRLLYQALLAGWDGAISGLAGVCPELLSSLYRSFREGRHEQARRLQALVNELAGKVEELPFPWAIRAALELRGISSGEMLLPLTPARHRQLDEFRQWFESWLQEHQGELFETQPG